MVKYCKYYIDMSDHKEDDGDDTAGVASEEVIAQVDAQINNVFHLDQEFLKEKRCLQKESNKLRQQITDLEQKVYENDLANCQLNDQRQALRNNLKAAVEKRNKYICGQWCSNFHFRLPYELRLAVYDHMNLPALTPLLGKRKPPCNPYLNKWIEEAMLAAFPTIFANPQMEHVGKQVAKEMLEATVKRATICIQHTAHPEWFLPNLFQAGVFDLGANLFEHVRHLRLAFDCNRILENPYEIDINCMDWLKTLPYRDSVTIRIYRSGEGNAQHKVLKVLEALAKWLYDARDNGQKFECGFKISGRLIDVWEFIGTSMADFEKFKATWPDVDDERGHTEFLYTLKARMKEIEKERKRK